MLASVCYSFCFVLTVYLHKFFKKVVFKHRKFSKSENIKYRVLAITIITTIFFIHSLLSFLQSDEKISFMETFQLQPNIFGVIYAIFVNSLLFMGPILQSFHYNDNNWSFLSGFSKFSEIFGNWDYLRVILFVNIHIFTNFLNIIQKKGTFLRRSGFSRFYIWRSEQKWI